MASPTTLAEILRQTGYAQDGELAAPAPVAPTMTSILQKHIASLPQQLATNQAAMNSAIGSWNKTDFGTGQPNPNYRPEAIQELTQLMPNVMGATAWHGTPHKIQGAFDISKVGTGEGAQAYGHGMYFAENPAVATEYRNVLAPGVIKKVDNQLYNSSNPEHLASHYINMFGKRGKSSEEIAKILTEEGGTEAHKLAAEIVKKGISKPMQTEKAGYLYKVDIPDEHIPNMLDWDKPISQQSKAIQDAAQQLMTGIKKIAPEADLSKMNGQGLYKLYQQYRGNNPDFASEGMNELGIKGIRYLDQNSRNPGFSSLTPTQLESRIQSLQSDIKSGGGNTQKMKDQLKGLQNELDSYKNMTSNFVVFDPSTVKILEENSKPVSRKALIEEQIKALKNAGE